MGICLGIQNNLKICDSCIFQLRNVFIFRVRSFNAFWTFLRLGNLACDFYEVFFLAQGFFGGFDFCPHSFDHPRHLKSWVATHPPLAPQQYVASTHFYMYAWVKRDKWSKVPCLRKQHYRKGLNPRPAVRGVNHSAKHTSKSIHYLLWLKFVSSLETPLRQGNNHLLYSTKWCSQWTQTYFWLLLNNYSLHSRNTSVFTG